MMSIIETAILTTGRLFLIVIASLAVTYPILRICYNIFFHPLVKYPGPKVAAVSRLPFVYWACTGILHSKLKELHDQYGDVVRVEPNKLVYRSAQAWKDICGHRKHGDASFIKDPDFYFMPPLSASLIGTNDADHARGRRLLSHAFSESALRKQEEIVQSYVDLLVDRLKQEVAASRDNVEIVRWYNFTTFDIIGDLAFGEPFDCLRNSQYHPWVELIFLTLKAGTYMRYAKFHPLLDSLTRRLVPKDIVQKRHENSRLSKEKARRRLEMETDRPDFMTYILRHNDERGMSLPEIEANSVLLIIAGSETTATLLSGCTFYLLKNPHVLERLVREVREAFSCSEDITFINVAKLSYLNAVLEESLRIYPPVPAVLPRRVPKGGAMINGQFVPENISVSMAYYSTFHAESNFKDPESFVPERWLSDDTASKKYANDLKEALQPFSYGPRNCLGKNLAYAEMRVILAKMLWNFDLSLPDESKNDWADQKSYTIWEKKPLMLRLAPAQR